MNNQGHRQEHRLLSFEPFRLDVRNAQLWQGPEVIRLTSKALAVLRYLAERSSQLVTKDELFAAVWPGVVVSDSALVACISELRRALGDARRTPRFIETAHGRGYRFIAPISISAQPVSSSAFQVSSSQPAPALPLPDKPSIAVLPFINMSGDSEQEYFSDGMAEDLITDLAKLSGLFVIARNSSFYYKYKGKAVKIEEVGKELGVQYVLEGSVRKADSQVRITAQLVDATTNYHLWAERYDRELQDIFALQDDIRQKIVTALRVKLLPEEQERLKYFPTNTLEAYDYVLRGQAYFFRFAKEANGQARQMFEKAIELDQQYAAAYAVLGMTYYTDWLFFWSDNPRAIEQGFALAQRAVTLNDFVPVAHWLLGLTYLHRKQYEQAIAEEERALALAPNATFGYIGLGVVLICVGRWEEAIALAERAMRLDPHFVGRYAFDLGHAYSLLRRYEEALAALQKTLTWNPNFLPAHGLLAAVYSELGREAEAQAEVAEVRRISPTSSLEGLRQRLPYKDPTVLEHRLAALRKAGLK
jgi:TolB-like protein/Tfp pilus assembly protein PilF